MTDLDALIRLCPPPNPPMTIDWSEVEADVGSGLPDDYKALAERYGPGTFCDYLTLYHPHGPTEYVNLTGPMPERIRAQLRTDYDHDTHPVPHHPDHLFACGVTSNGEYLLWITETTSEPDSWQIAVNEARGPLWYAHHGTITNFLVSVLTGQIQVPQFPVGLLQSPPVFTPSHPVLIKTEPVDAPPPPPVDAAVIRTWAREHGYAVPMRGRIPPNLLEAWETAHRH
ncbi:hypothetical protein ACH4E8_26730 [Streptomyces sp. NPDC017979]|uniref:Lsr2 family DNA-binding protein n=1 Tax=Streptomyces sp. NPDC017979 TaxID=3365024 RepID=UPI0037B85E22